MEEAPQYLRSRWLGSSPAPLLLVLGVSSFIAALGFYFCPKVSITASAASRFRCRCLRLTIPAAIESPADVMPWFKYSPPWYAPSLFDTARLFIESATDCADLCSA